MSDIKTSIIIDLAGNLTRNARRYTDSIKKFSTTSQRHLAGLGRVSKLAFNNLDRMGNRWTALATGAAATATGRYLIGLEKRMVRIGIQADLSVDQIDKLKRKIFETAAAPDIRIDPGELTSAIEEVLTKTGKLDLAEENIRNIALAMQASGASGQSIGAMIADMQQKFGLKDKDAFLTVLDLLVLQGKAGAFELRDLANQGERVSAAYAATGRTGKVALREMGAILQMTRRGVGSAEEAATAFERLIGTITQEKTKELQQAGIQLWDAEELAKGNKMARSIPDIIKDIIRKTGGDTEKLATVFDVRALRALIPFAIEFKKTGAFESFDNFLSIQADGAQLMKDSGKAANTASAALTKLFSALKKYSDKKLTGSLQTIADAFNSMDANNLERVFAVIAGGAAGLIALSLFAGGIRNLKTIGGVFRGGKSGGAGSSIPGLGAGVQPVYVVNFPGAKLPGIGGNINKGTVPGKARFLNKNIARSAFNQRNMKGIAALGAGALTTAAIAVAASAAAGIGIGTVIDKKLQKSEGGREFRHNLGGTIATILARLGNDNAQAALDREFNSKADIGGTLNIKIDSEGRSKVTQLEKNGGLDFDVDAGMAMSAL